MLLSEHEEPAGSLLFMGRTCLSGPGITAANINPNPSSSWLLH